MNQPRCWSPPSAYRSRAARVGIAGHLHGVGVEVEDGVGAGSGLEPDVEDVHLLAEWSIAAIRATNTV